jgi:hypothetical protein
VSNIQKKNIKASLEKPNKPENGRWGRMKTKTTIRMVAIDKYLPGKLLKKGPPGADYQNYQCCGNDTLRKPACLKNLFIRMQ